MDGFGHGSHVASIAAGNGTVFGGAYRGVAPGAKIINVRVLDNQGIGKTTDLVGAIDWIISNKTAYNIRVINLSLGTAAKDSYTVDPLCLAARRAVNAGIVVVASAGNYGKSASGGKLYGTISSPGIEPSVITVGASNTFGTDGRNDDQVASFSSKGPTRGYVTLNSGTRKYDNLIKPDLVAPGNKIIAAQGTAFVPVVGMTFQNNLSIKAPALKTGDPAADNNNKLMYLSGTSMAAPVVSGAVALLLQANPNLTPNLVKAILMYSAQPIKNADSFEQGAGQLNIDGAARLARLVRTTLPTTNGAALLNAALPASQSSVIGGQTAFWGKGVITNFGFLYGNDLMNKYQGMYGSGVLISDGTLLSGSSLVRSSAMTSGAVNVYSGSIQISGNGVLISDGVLVSDSYAMSSGATLGQGVLISDGVLVSDGVLISDGGAMAFSALLGENTSGMSPAP